MTPRSDQGVTEATAATRRRTRCVYCGTRIPGAVTREERNHTTKAKLTPQYVLAARLTCLAHRDLPLSDPAYDYMMERAR